jgi:hypothetical protein
VGLERGPFVRITEELFQGNSGRGDSLRWPRDTLYPQKLAQTSPTGGGRSVGIVRLRTQATELVFSLFSLLFFFLFPSLVILFLQSFITCPCNESLRGSLVSVSGLEQIILTVNAAAALIAMRTKYRKCWFALEPAHVRVKLNFSQGFLLTFVTSYDAPFRRNEVWLLCTRLVFVTIKLSPVLYN